MGENRLQEMFFLILDAPKLVYLLPLVGISIQQALEPLPQSFVTHLTDPCFHLFVVYLSFLQVYAISELQSFEL
jgi:positive regulator of sigma E activity